MWRELAEHAVAEFGVAPPTFLRDRDDPSMFVTFGAWDSLETLGRFRASPLVAERSGVLNDLLAHRAAAGLEPDPRRAAAAARMWRSPSRRRRSRPRCGRGS